MNRCSMEKRSVCRGEGRGWDDRQRKCVRKELGRVEEPPVTATCVWHQPRERAQKETRQSDCPGVEN